MPEEPIPQDDFTPDSIPENIGANTARLGEPDAATSRRVVKEVYTDDEEKKAVKAQLLYAEKIFKKKDASPREIDIATEIFAKFDRMKHGGIQKPVDEKKDTSIFFNLVDVNNNNISALPTVNNVDEPLMVDERVYSVNKAGEKVYRQRKTPRKRGLQAFLSHEAEKRLKGEA